MNPDKARTILNVLFLIGVAISVIIYFAVEDRKIFLFAGGVSVCIKLMEFVIRFTHR